MEKAEQVNSLLGQPEDGLPPVSLSAGIAFSDLTAPDGDVFRDAENALNRQSGE